MENQERPLLFYENDYASYQIENDILIQTFKNKAAHLTLEIAQVIVQDRQKLTQGQPVLHLSVLNFLCTANAEALNYFGSAPESLADVKAGCLLINNWVRYVVATAWLLAFRSKIPFPVNVVKSKEAGITWLKNQTV